MLEAVDAWCIAQIEQGRVYDGNRRGPTAALREQVLALRAMTEDPGRLLCNRLRAALHEAKEHLRIESARGTTEDEVTLKANNAAQKTGPTMYSRELRRIVDAVTDGGAWPPNGSDSEITIRRRLVSVLDTPRKSEQTNREIATLSLLAGNGADWALAHCKKAQASGAVSDRPTVLDAVRGEQNAIAIMRKRVAQETTDRQAWARDLDEGRMTREDYQERVRRAKARFRDKGKPR